MSQLRRRTTKIDLQVKLYALEMYNKGTRVSMISKQIGYSEPTIKYWINHSDTILAQEPPDNVQLCIEAALPSEIDLFTDESASIKRMTKNCDIAGDLKKYYGKRPSAPDPAAAAAPSPSKKKQRLSQPIITAGGDAHTNGLFELYRRDNSASSSKDAKSIERQSKSPTKMFHGNHHQQQPPQGHHLPQSLNHLQQHQQLVHQLQSQSMPSISIDLHHVQQFYGSHNDTDFRNFQRDADNCRETIDGLVEFIASGKRLLNKASHFLYELQARMAEYEIRRKVKFEHE